MTNVKWLTAITAVDAPFTGYQQTGSYLMRQHEDEPGLPVTQIMPRALMIPPGIPDFFTRARQVGGSDVRLAGRAWSGVAPITAVAVSTDGGASWEPAQLDPPTTLGVWQAWTYAWRAKAGTHELCCRASDAAGNTQPLAPSWNLGGYTNNAVQRLQVVVA